MNSFNRHYAEAVLMAASAPEVFDFVNNHANFSSHMSQSSWMMGGGSMKVETDEGRGQRVGSHIRMGGTAFGVRLFLDEVVTEYDPPRRKVWETVGNPKLIIIGNYRMGVEIVPESNGSRLKVFIDYDLPAGAARIWGYLGAGFYAKWCVRQMLKGVQKYFVV